MYGWTVAHFPKSTVGRSTHATAIKYDAKGFPDLVLARRQVVLFREIKRELGKLTDDQQRWGDILPNFAVWRPSMWNEILAELR